MEYGIYGLILFIVMCNAGELKATDNPVIIFKRPSSSKPENALYYKVVKHKPLTLLFQNMSIANGWCYNYYQHGNYMDYGDMPPIANFTSVQYDMSVLWKCNVTEDEDTKLKRNYVVFYLNLHVMGAQSVYLTLNGKEVTFNETDLSVPYDGETIFHYKDGDHVDIFCRNRYTTGAVDLEYFMRGVNVSGSAKFSIELHSESNNSFIECVYRTVKPVDKYVYRITFIKKQLIYSIENKTQPPVEVAASASEDRWDRFTLLIASGFMGIVLIFLAVTGLACWCVRTRKVKEIPYVVSTDHTPQPTFEHQHDVCVNHHPPNKDTHYDIPDVVENTEPIYHFYTEINYFACKPKMEAQRRNSYVYDEPYVQIKTKERVQMSRV